MKKKTMQNLIQEEKGKKIYPVKQNRKQKIIFW